MEIQLDTNSKLFAFWERIYKGLSYLIQELRKRYSLQTIASACS